MPARFSGSAALMVTRPPSAGIAESRAALDGVRQRELFARHAGDEAAAADLAARLEPPVDAGQLAPRRRVRLARQQPPEHDAVAAEQRPRLRLDGRVARCRARRPARDQPSSGRRSCARRSRDAGAPARAHDQRAQPGEAVRGREAGGDERRRSRCRGCLVVEPARRRADRAKNDAPRDAQRGEHAAAPPSPSRVRLALAGGRAASATRRRARAGTARSASPAPAASASVARRGREPRPADLAGEAEHVEHRRLVAVDARRQDRALPRAGRAARSRRACATTSRSPSSAGQPVDGVDVLPREQEAHEVGRADRLDLRAQAVQRVAMDAREQRAVAPFERRVGRAPAREARRAGRRLRLRARAAPRRRPPTSIAERRGERRGGRRADDRQPAAQQLDDRVVARPRSRGARRRRRDRRLERRMPGWTRSSSGSRSAATSIGRSGVDPRCARPRGARVSSRDRAPADVVELVAASGSRRSAARRAARRRRADRDAPRRARARSRPRRARRGRRRRRLAGAPRVAPPASAAPRAARRRGTRTAAR